MRSHQHPDLVTLVDSNDQVLGELDKYQAHRQPAQLHRASSVWLFRRSASGQVETLWQQRSPQKIVGSGWWGNTICGNVWPDESNLECALRRLDDELRIKDGCLQLKKIFKFSYQAWGNNEYAEHEVDSVFAGWWDGQFSPVPSEVSWAGWVEFRELTDQVKRAMTVPGFTEASEVESLRLKDRELQRQTKPVEVEIKLSGSTRPQKMLLHYWGVRMLLHPALLKFVKHGA